MSRNRHVRALKAADAFALEALRPSGRPNRVASSPLVSEIRRVAVRSGGALVAASANPAGGAEERALLERARTDLVRTRYYLYLARRMGLLELDHYRGLASRHAAALREIETLLDFGVKATGRAPP